MQAQQFLALALLFFSLLATQVHAQPYDSSLHWSTLETDHFLIHYHDGLRDVASGLTNDAEEIYHIVTTKLQWQPKAKTHIVLNDRIDVANGQAYPTPANTVELYVTAPADISGLEDFDVWLRDVLLHEFVHIVHIDKASGIPYGLRQVFGRISFPNFLLPAFPNALEPNWIIEGLATYLETDKENKFGRGQNSYFRGLMRVEVANGFKSLRQLNQPLDSWPGKTSWYLYGVFFFQFIQDKYGEESINRFIDVYSYSAIPFFLNPAAESVFGKDFYALWDEFEQAMKTEFDPEITQINSTPLNPANAITDTAFYTGNAHVLANGDLIYVQSEPGQIPRLVLRSQKTQDVRTITTLNSAEIRLNRFDVHPQQGIVISMLDISHSANVFYDLYRIDIETGNMTRLTHDGRYFVSAWSPDGKNIVAAKNQHGYHSLELLNNDGTLIETLWLGEPDTYLSSLAWSPNGKLILASVFRRHHGWNLELFDLSKRTWQRITNTEAIESQASFLNDDSILFTADYTRVFNIYQMNLRDKRVKQLSNVLGGAFYPAVAANGETLYFTALNKNGYDVYQSTTAKFIEQTPISAPETKSRTAFTSSRTVVEKPRDYPGFAYSRPQWWLPKLLIDNYDTVFGLQTSGEDPLSFHQYDAILAMDIKNVLPIWSINYSYNRWYPTLNVFSSRIYTNRLNNEDLVYILANDQVGASIQIPYIRSNFQTSALVGTARNTESYSYTNPQYIIFGTLARESQLFVQARLNTAKKPATAVSPMSGFSTLGNITDVYDENSKAHSKVSIAQLMLYSPSLYNTVFSAQALGGLQTGQLSPFELGNSLESYFEKNVISRKIQLRGYPFNIQNTNLTGSRVQSLSVEWHTPLFRKETGMMVIPLGMNRLYGHLFMDMGRAWDAGESQPAFSRSVGAEITIEATAGYRFPFVVNVGVAKGLDAFGESQVYISLN